MKCLHFCQITSELMVWSYHDITGPDFGVHFYWIGSARTSLIITIGPSARHHAETTSTIMFGQRVSNFSAIMDENSMEHRCLIFYHSIPALWFVFSYRVSLVFPNVWELSAFLIFFMVTCFSENYGEQITLSFQSKKAIRHCLIVLIICWRKMAYLFLVIFVWCTYLIFTNTLFG